ncbi:TauD/TfdA family dioxygenase [Pseudoalteromonas luteoviolacea]|uniref:Taurine catabolism dioxygenase TauD/TfdA n=1 Tax=Pseudoalteromonas luteoviolacea S4060-1 TaxID=1365257 RepID=A0A167NVW2_9GAMM|nr:TauD/TfdA family dioxygenase [Pseudoalteromonas luteoviolacea]KZN31908.1 taurine catabolism dioxygenase TauD/TfdA [Pseudoalteromonas luteoviolacea S2607]KZN68927.1 taurine catabolism dioxygenase TauD/TfdA [Pseudoalteromonas luteoviolacea S4060-1]
MDQLLALDNEASVAARDRFIHDLSAHKQSGLAWVKSHIQEINAWVDKDGVALLRGLNIVSTNQFSSILEAIFGEQLSQYVYRSSPRTALRNNVYTTTEYHADQVILQHNENAYSNCWPMRMGFFCVVPAKTGGNTPLADSREVYKQLPLALRDKFEKLGVMYVRNYGDIDLPWQEVFQTQSKEEVEAYCWKNDIIFEWKSDNHLQTKQIRPAVAIHPQTKEKVWFNQAHLFHCSSIDNQMPESMRESIGLDRLPRNAYFGDGSEISAEDIATINEVYKSLTFAYQWQRNDIMLLDNMLYTHGREAYTGTRKVLVGMAKAAY